MCIPRSEEEKHSYENERRKMYVEKGKRGENENETKMDQRLTNTPSVLPKRPPGYNLILSVRPTLLLYLFVERNPSPYGPLHYYRCYDLHERIDARVRLRRLQQTFD